MPVTTKVDWKPWHEERKRIARRQTEGIEADIAALADHIRRLIAVAPTDKTGWPHPNALSILRQLVLDHRKATRLLQRPRLSFGKHYD